MQPSGFAMPATLTRRAALAAAFAASAVRARAQGAEIIVGAAIPITGAFAASGIQYYNSLRLAQDDINAAGGINGRTLRIDFEDTQASNSVAVNAFVKLVKQSDLPFVFLSSLSSQDLATEPDVAKETIPVMYGGGADAIGARHDKWMFHIRPNDSLQGPAMAYAVKDYLKKSKPGIIHSQDDYGTGAANSAAAALTAAGVTPVTQEAYSPRDNDFSAQLLAIKSKGADVIVAFTYNRDGGLILSQRKSLGIDLPYVGGSATIAPSTLSLINADDLAGVLGVGDAVLGSSISQASAEFVKRYAAKFGFDPDPYGAAYYDGAMMLADALRKVGPDREKLRAYFATIKDYHGVSRVFTTDADNDMAHSLTLVRFKRGTKEYDAIATFPRAA
jgi:branched-chain amino acid transport system substrate-binding protein